MDIVKVMTFGAPKWMTDRRDDGFLFISIQIDNICLINMYDEDNSVMSPYVNTLHVLIVRSFVIK